MTGKRVNKIRSFIIILYNQDFEKIGFLFMPVSAAAPFANRLFNELLPDWRETVWEPWYVLAHHFADELPFRRSAYPVGPTSLYGTGYSPPDEPPPRVQLHPEATIRYFTVRLLDFQTELYRGEYGVDDIFLAGAEYMARRWIEKGNIRAEDGPFYYEVIPSSEDVYTVSPDLFPPEAYRVEGIFQLPQLTEDRERTVFRKVQPPPLPERSPDSYGDTTTYGRGERGDGRIFMSADVYHNLREKLELSYREENGGYLLGVPYRHPGSPEKENEDGFRWLVEITDVVMTGGTWGQPALLLFSGESWSQVTRLLDREYSDRKLIAWFHSHLFSASDEFGLSGLDQDLHRRYLTKPWQVAVLLNIDSEGEREVRCFQRGPEGDLVECTFEVFEPEPGEETV